MQTTPAPRLKSLSPTNHQFFRDNGYLLLPNALSPADLQSMLALFNISALHTATVRRTTTQRKTIQIYYGHLDRPALSPDSFIPDTFWHSHADPAVCQFYSKLTDKTKIFLQGTGLPGL